MNAKVNNRAVEHEAVQNQTGLGPRNPEYFSRCPLEIDGDLTRSKTGT